MRFNMEDVDVFFERAQDYIESFIPHVLQSTVCCFNAKKTVKVNDPILGVTEKLLQLVVVAYIVLDLAYNEAYFEETVPRGWPTFEFARHDFDSQRNKSFSAFPYCSNSSYDYHRPNAQGEKRAADDYWNDQAIICKQGVYADVIKQDTRTAYITTMEKREVQRTVDCNDRNYCVAESPNSILLNGGNPSVIQDSAGGSGHSCTCSELRNFFYVAPEALGLQLSSCGSVRATASSAWKSHTRSTLTFWALHLLRTAAAWRMGPKKIKNDDLPKRSR